ncbi:MAG: carboxy-S-adenosyl-L-methionine synthase CmoA [Desulfuromonadales bacterium]|nr:carboxy-S-adenosyl-L-methionine synthase CmoA [Desulfuromonadales bacterium]NIR34313.1 carboxy-S-adenosyl-L-methionine synthase CmoA [Desulfuromonadales bacterium]NIS44288.1 carboxy-S-adenosyl-L-methionine synthase CmoA [Desulfuromonadales bacterium]
MSRDRIFSRRRRPVEPFRFDERVVEVFDDMLERSVPLYRESLMRQAQLTRRFHNPGGRIYDLGCSNGNFGMTLRHEMAETDFTLTAVDSSAPMLATYRRRLEEAGETRIELIEADVRHVDFAPAGVIVVNLTLQFVPPADRLALLRKIHQALLPGGILLLTEKVIHGDDALDELQQEFYYRFKAENGYSQLEISQKREALEDVLIPETIDAHLERLNRCGFAGLDVWLKWFNFASIIARKEA